MNDSAWIWPASDMDFWKIDNKETSVKIKWSHNCFEDYKTLSYQFYKCGYKTFEEVIGSGHDNVKSDMWFLTGIFLVRHSIELGLKALLCRVLPRKRDIEDAFEACCHDVSMLFHKYTDVRLENYLTEEEEDWLIRYLDSLEEVDKKSDMFRFPFEDEFLSKYRDKFLDNVDVANNMLQGYALVKKCIERGIVTEEDEFDGKLKPEFFVFASHGIGNCYLWQRISDEGFHVKVTGYSEVIDYIYQNQNITNENKLYPLIFMFRNTIELCLKRLFYSRVDNGVPAEQVQGVGAKALQFVKQHKKGTIIVVASAVAVGAGAWVCNKVKNHEPKVVTEFRASLKSYIDAIRKGEMDIDKINNLMSSLEALKADKNYSKINIQLTSEELDVLVGRIYEYTLKLASDNEIEIAADDLEEEKDVIKNLQSYLKVQRRIFAEAA